MGTDRNGREREKERETGKALDMKRERETWRARGAKRKERMTEECKREESPGY